MCWTKAMLLLMCVSVLAAPAPVYTGLVTAVAPVDEYAAREAQAADLESFTGGWHGVVLTLILLGVVVWVVLEVFHHEHPDAAQPAPAPETPKP